MNYTFSDPRLRRMINAHKLNKVITDYLARKIYYAI